ncbi:pik3r4 kinase-related protein [Cyclospora cayetanensis]|uniref:Pik3r4 kinase-related protein n=1 Tax=Cyclospora cayetanensis TaxID=88456 RepID=A0A1D3CZB9_9EIME|nr:pik3r4 kinase-related protein [Cyclospora cayetanensis]
MSPSSHLSAATTCVISGGPSRASLQQQQLHHQQNEQHRKQQPYAGAATTAYPGVQQQKAEGGSSNSTPSASENCRRIKQATNWLDLTLNSACARRLTLRECFCSASITADVLVAVKILSLAMLLKSSPSLQEDFLSELTFYDCLKGHPNIVTPARVYVDLQQQLLLLLFPLAEFEDLFEVLKKRKEAFKEAEVRWIARQLLDAVLFLHRRGVAMRDLSLENVLVFRCEATGAIVPCLTDPGQAVVALPSLTAASLAAEQQQQKLREDEPLESLKPAAIRDTDAIVARALQDGSPGGVMLPPNKLFGKSFRPPEVYSRRPYDPFKVDSFCLGWMVYYCLTKQQLFRRAQPSDEFWSMLASEHQQQLWELLQHKNGSRLSPVAIDFVLQLLRPDPAKRLSVRDALRHPFLSKGPVSVVYANTLLPPLQHQQPQQHNAATTPAAHQHQTDAPAKRMQQDAQRHEHQQQQQRQQQLALARFLQQKAQALQQRRRHEFQQQQIAQRKTAAAAAPVAADMWTDGNSKHKQPQMSSIQQEEPEQEKQQREQQQPRRPSFSIPKKPLQQSPHKKEAHQQKHPPCSCCCTSSEDERSTDASAGCTLYGDRIPPPSLIPRTALSDLYGPPGPRETATPLVSATSSAADCTQRLTHGESHRQSAGLEGRRPLGRQQQRCTTNKTTDSSNPSNCSSLTQPTLGSSASRHHRQPDVAVETASWTLTYGTGKHTAIEQQNPLKSCGFMYGSTGWAGQAAAANNAAA